MKHAHPYLQTAVVLAWLAGLVSPVAAQTANTDNSASVVKTAPASAAPVSPASGPIHYFYDEAPLDRSNHGPVASYADMLDKVTPGVVGIYPSRKIVPVATNPARRGGRRGGNYTPPTPPPDMIWSDAESNRYRVMGVGSGCIISADGYIVTNHHVVTDDQTGQSEDGFLVKLSDGREFEGKLIGSDELTDLALIKIDAKNLPVIKMANSEKIKVGDVVFAVGNPMDVGLTVTHGIVSALGRSSLDLIGDPNNSSGTGFGFEDFIQTDAAINPGNSGGPLVDVQGRLVGLNTAIVSGSPEGGSIGIGFSIPASLVRKVADDLIRDGKVRRGALGVASQEVSRDLAKAKGLPNTHGALVDEFDPPNGPASSSGVKPGDVIVKLNDDEVDSPAKLHYLVALADPGSTVNLTVLRDGQPKEFKVRLADRDVLFGGDQVAASSPSNSTSTPRYTPGPNPVTPPTAIPPRNANGITSDPASNLSQILPNLRQQRINSSNTAPDTETTSSNPNEILSGVSLTPLADETRQELNLPKSISAGLVVTDIARNSPFYYDFRNRTVVITEVNGKPVSTLDQLRVQLKPGAVNLFYVYHVDNDGSSAGWTYIAEPQPAAR